MATKYDELVESANTLCASLSDIVKLNDNMCRLFIKEMDDPYNSHNASFYKHTSQSLKHLILRSTYDSSSSLVRKFAVVCNSAGLNKLSLSFFDYALGFEKLGLNDRYREVNASLGMLRDKFNYSEIRLAQEIPQTMKKDSILQNLKNKGLNRLADVLSISMAKPS